jgi:hypothetical protein
MCLPVDGLSVLEGLSCRSLLSGEEGWGWQVLARVADLCRTHVVRLRFEQAEGKCKLLC